MTDTPTFSQGDISVTGPWRSGDVKCQYVSDCNFTPPGFGYVDEIWIAHKNRYPLAHDGPMLGLAAILEGTSTGLRLAVRPTSYSQYLATRSPSFTATHPGMSRANPLGTTIIVLTADGMVVVTRRSMSADQNPGMTYFVGGYVEPVANADVASVIGATMTREVTEELGIKCSNVIVLGVANDPIFCHPEVCAVSRVCAKAEEISKAWQKACDKSETSELLLISLPELLSCAPEKLFPGGVTWSFASASHLLRRCWKDAAALLGG
jgi:8-oxo-dGTP pyrophosphatase MutT (NUDIX family)